MKETGSDREWIIMILMRRRDYRPEAEIDARYWQRDEE